MADDEAASSTTVATAKRTRDTTTTGEALSQTSNLKKIMKKPRVVQAGGDNRTTGEDGYEEKDEKVENVAKTTLKHEDTKPRPPATDAATATLTGETTALVSGKPTEDGTGLLTTIKKPIIRVHGKLREAQNQGVDQLTTALELLMDPKNELFCPPSLRDELCGEIKEELQHSAPYTIIGCLGGTGAGKSSLLNALLNEADILPTSGSRGCTAAVVELRFNRDFMELTSPIRTTTATITVYKGIIEFITMENWKAELELLLDDCCDEESQQISSTARDNEEAVAAWDKIDSVYGHGTMQSHEGKDKASVLDTLTKDKRVVELLTGANGKTNTIAIEEGKVDGAKAKLLLEYFSSPLQKRHKKLAREKKQWAKTFRRKINDYVYRKGNGKEPQTWPLIRKVVLRGPWAVLSTGACLVDMPGVRDANAARAKVAERYLQNCHKIWIVAPIQRAVDDKTAKDLMGEEFRRRLLMDGQYGNVGFICTRSDDCEISETMQDHEDVARSKEGRWEQMLEWRDEIAQLEKERDELQQRREDLEVDASDDEEDSYEDNGSCEGTAGKSSGAKQNNLSEVTPKKRDIEKVNEALFNCEIKIRSKQQKLKATAAMVRNEFSALSLQADFQKGIEEVMQVSSNEEKGNPTETAAQPIPEGFQLEVFCTASNEYLKLQKIKAGSDGSASCFAYPKDTQIPAVVDSVHNTTADFCKDYAEKKITSIGGILARIHLCATEDQANSVAGRRYQEAFETAVTDLEEEIKPIASEFKKSMQAMVKSELEPSLRRAAVKGNRNAMHIVESWQSSSRRTKHERGRKKNGLHHNTYNAAMRHQGVFKSSVAGQINLNQELCDPLEKEFTGSWHLTMDAGANNLLANARQHVLEYCTKVTQSLDDAFQLANMDPERALTLATTAKQSCDMAVKAAFSKMKQNLTETQRKLNRSLLSKMAKKMAPSYTAASNVPGGLKRFSRQTAALKDKAEKALVNKFDHMMTNLLNKVAALENDLATDIRKIPGLIEHKLRQIYSVCWNDQEYAEAMKDPKVRLGVRACRNRLLPSIISLLEANEATMDLLGIAHDTVEYNVVGIETQDDRLAKSMVEAQAKGRFFDLMDDSEDDIEAGETKAAALGAPAPPPLVLVKPEPGTSSLSQPKQPASQLSSSRAERPQSTNLSSSYHHRQKPTGQTTKHVVGAAHTNWQQNHYNPATGAARLHYRSPTVQPLPNQTQPNRGLMPWGAWQTPPPSSFSSLAGTKHELQQHPMFHSPPRLASGPPHLPPQVFSGCNQPPPQHTKITTLTRSSGLSNADLQSIFECIHNNKTPPPKFKCHVITAAGPAGSKLSPPSLEFEGGLYILLKPGSSQLPAHLKGCVMKQQPTESCHWSISGPQFRSPTLFQQRYCYPKGKEEYAGKMGGILWTMCRADGEEDLEFRLLHVYISTKRALNSACNIPRNQQRGGV